MHGSFRTARPTPTPTCRLAKEVSREERILIFAKKRFSDCKVDTSSVHTAHDTDTAYDTPQSARPLFVTGFMQPLCRRAQSRTCRHAGACWRWLSPAPPLRRLVLQPWLQLGLALPQGTSAGSCTQTRHIQADRHEAGRSLPTAWRSTGRVAKAEERGD